MAVFAITDTRSCHFVKFCLMISGSTPRVHVVLVPGFAGFDALGQLEYYSGITPLFQAFAHDNHALHYFDNFPTAAVTTRAARLQRYLAKRIARGSIAKDDEVCLIGHSTGGLDIRRLLWDLHHHRGIIVLDGGAKVDLAEIRNCIRRVVFLSVPHHGTNIADWVQSQWIWRKALIDQLRAAIAGSQLLVVEPIESLIAGGAAVLARAGLLFAVQDALDESDEHIGKQSPTRSADAHEAASELALYLRHMASDFHALDDLTARPPQFSKSKSPAHFDEDDRDEEKDDLKDIEFLSLATIGPRAESFEAGKPASPWVLAKPWTYPNCWGSHTDIVYRACYRACAGGPFESSDWCRREAKRLSPKEPIEVWDNDGIVNTLSMFWRLGRNILVHADHMDIVGQYHNVHASPGGARTYQTYDLLRSGSKFDQKAFTGWWQEIFRFALGRTSGMRELAASA